MLRLVFASIALGATAATLAGCASYPAPVQRMADAEAAARSAEDTGAANIPQGQLHLNLAKEGVAQAKTLMREGHNERADYVLMRAKSDAELALAEAREAKARAEAQKALQEVAEFKSTNASANPGDQP